jgi:hypothetical protein
MCRKKVSNWWESNFLLLLNALKIIHTGVLFTTDIIQNISDNEIILSVFSFLFSKRVRSLWIWIAGPTMIHSMLSCRPILLAFTFTTTQEWQNENSMLWKHLYLYSCWWRVRYTRQHLKTLACSRLLLSPSGKVGMLHSFLTYMLQLLQLTKQERHFMHSIYA